MKMDDNNDILVCASEYIKDRLYFVTLRTSVKPKSTANTHYFSIDEELVYENFYADFGPLNLAMLYHYCHKLNKKLKSVAHAKKKIVHYTSMASKKRANAAFLIASYSMLYLRRTPEEAYRPLVGGANPPLLPFRDASFGPSTFPLNLIDCLHALDKARKLGFFDLDDFNVVEYEYYEKVQNGDLNWIVPNLFLAFCGPHSKSKVEYGYTLHSPESYFSYFRQHDVTTIVRLNKKAYDASRFVSAGFQHVDLFFVDGSTPSDAIMRQFLELSEQSPGGLAIHCKAGLGRTGSLIACYLMKHYKFTSAEAIAWLRICRPGSIIGRQQHWLQEKESYLWLQGDIYMSKHKDNKLNQRCPFPIYSLKSKKNYTKAKGESGTNDKLTKMTTKVDSMKISDSEEKTKEKYIEDVVEKEGETQGDHLTKIKALRHNTRDLPKTVPHRPHPPATLLPLKPARVSPVTSSLSPHRDPTNKRVLRSSINTAKSTRSSTTPKPPKSALIR